MSKIICDVCGTRYPASAEQCPICGRVDPAAAKAEVKEVETAYGRTYSQTKGGHFSKSNVKKRTQGAPVIEVPEEPVKEEEVAVEQEVYELEEKKKKSGCLINFLLVIVILALLAASAYIAVQYVMPEVIERFIPQASVATEEVTEPSTEAPTEAPTEEITEEPTVPCTDLVLLESVIMIDEVGQSYLLNAAVAPEDTTDELIFTSADESIAVVNEDGRVTAVAPGTTVITVSCGEFSAECTVVCAANEVTVPTEAEGEGETTATEGDATEATQATEAPAPTKPALKDVKLSVKRTDVTFVHRGQQATFKLTCKLDPTEVTWTSQDENIIVVDENGVATCKGYGTTNVIVSYGDQQVTIIVRCTKK